MARLHDLSLLKKRFIILIFVKTYFVVTKRSKTAIYTPSINGNPASPTHIVRLVATLSSSIKESGPQKDGQID